MLKKHFSIGDSFYDYCNRYSLGYDRGDLYIIDSFDLSVIDSNNDLFFAKSGGLVMGPLHVNGGVNLIQKIDIDKYRYVGEMEGWEYLTRPLKKKEHNELSLINKSVKGELTDEDSNFEIPNKCRVIDTRTSKTPFLLLSESNQLIINRKATKKYIRTIVEIDK